MGAATGKVRPYARSGRCFLTWRRNEACFLPRLRLLTMLHTLSFSFNSIFCPMYSSPTMASERSMAPTPARRQNEAQQKDQKYSDNLASIKNIGIALDPHSSSFHVSRELALFLDPACRVPFQLSFRFSTARAGLLAARFPASIEDATYHSSGHSKAQRAERFLLLVVSGKARKLLGTPANDSRFAPPACAISCSYPLHPSPPGQQHGQQHGQQKGLCHGPFC